MGNEIRKLKKEIPPEKDSVSPVKYIPDDEVVLVFVEKFGSRFITRIKIDKILLNYLTQVNITLPFPPEKEFHLNLMKILGYFFYTSLFILIFEIIYFFNLFDRFIHRL
jgi:hypothetical protein